MTKKSNRKAFTLAEGATHVDMSNRTCKKGFTLAEGATHVDMSNSYRKAAFTLAEVLITIGIIGVVAALTIPALITNTQNEQYRTRFKKTISTLAQASRSAYEQFDMDYSGISQNSDPSTCATDNLADSKNTMCALFNNTLKGKSYLGTYGTYQGRGEVYSFTKTTDGFNPSNYILYSLADGTIVGFNPNAKNCHIEVGSTLTSSALGSGGNLNSCVGFIDVNGPSLPNREVTCADGTSALDPATPCEVKFKGEAMGDVFPIVFHNGSVEPATNASRAIFNAISGKNAANNITTEPINRKKITYKAKEYELYSDYSNGRGIYLREDEYGNLISTNNIVFTKQDDGTYQKTDANGTYVYDKNMNYEGLYKNGEWYNSLPSGFFVKEDDYGNLINSAGQTFTKRADGYYELNGYIYDKDLKPIQNIQGYEAKCRDYSACKYVKQDNNGNYYDTGGNVFAKQADGTYQRMAGSNTIVYDENLLELYMIKNDEQYFFKPASSLYAKTDNNGNLVTNSGYVYSKLSDGLYQYNGNIYDEDLRKLGSK